MAPDLERQLAAARGLEHAGNWAGAARVYTSVLAVDPAHIDALAGLANCRMNQGEQSDAADAADALVAAAPDQAIGHQYRARQALRAGNWRGAIASATEAVRLEPFEPMNYHVLAAAHVGRKKFRAALKAVDQALELAPDSTVLQAQKAAVLLETKGARAVQPWIDEALEGGGLDNDYVLLQAGSVALARNRLDVARDFLGEALRHDANDETTLSLYLLTDRRRYHLVRMLHQAPYWRREFGLLSWIAWVVMVLLAAMLVVAVAITTHVPGIAIALVYRGVLQSRYDAHRKAVRDHFRQASLKAGY